MSKSKVFLLLLLLCLYAGSSAASGIIIVNHDEWTLSNKGFSSADAASFALNVARLFADGQPGSFLAYSANFGLTESMLAETMTAAGHQWHVNASETLTLTRLRDYDGIFLASKAVDNTLLTDYVNAGGNVYIAGGTTSSTGTTAALWNEFLNGFGLTFASSVNHVRGTKTISSTHPIFDGVASLYYVDGNYVSLLDTSPVNAQILEGSVSSGLIAMYAPTPTVDDGFFVTDELWLKAVLQVAGNPVSLTWKMVGADITPSGDQVISGYFYADPDDFAYGSAYNPELFVKIYISTNGWCNIACNHVMVDDVTVYSAHHYDGSPLQTGLVSLTNRLVEHTYGGVAVDRSLQTSGATSPSSTPGGYDLTADLWANAILQPSGGPVDLIWKEVGSDTTPSGDRVVSGYFFASPADFPYGSVFNPEVFVKVYIASNGWINVALNHVTVDRVDISSAFHYSGTADQTGMVTLGERLLEHQYDQAVNPVDTEDDTGDTNANAGDPTANTGDPGPCVTVSQGGWEFEWAYKGMTILSFVNGELKQSGCYVTYDDDNIFSGSLIGSTWSGENTTEGFSFTGTFYGNPATRFDGTWTDLATGKDGTMTGVKGTLE